MASKRRLADLDMNQQETDPRVSNTTKRSSYPSAFATTSELFDGPERHLQQSTGTSRSARTLPLPSPTWFNSTNTYSSQSLPAWEAQGPQTAQDQSSQQFLICSPSGNKSRPAQSGYAGLVKQDHCSPPSFVDFDESSQGLAREPSKPETERQRLKAEIGHLQAQIEDLHQQMDLFKQHAAKRDTQYLQIIEQSTRREAQGVADSQKWHEDRKQWADERRLLQGTIAGLNTKLNELHTNYSRGRNPKVSTQESSVSTNAIFSEQNIRQSTGTTGPWPSPLGMEEPLDQLQYESGQLAEYSSKLVDIGKNIRLQLELMKATSSP